MSMKNLQKYPKSTFFSVVLFLVIVLYIYRDTFRCYTGIYSSCEILETTLTIDNSVLYYSTDQFMAKLSAESVIQAYRRSPQCANLAEDFAKAVENTNNLIDALRTASCRAVGPIEAMVSSARENKLVLERIGSPPEIFKIAYIRHSYVYRELIILDGDIILEVSDLR